MIIRSFLCLLVAVAVGCTKDDFEIPDPEPIEKQEIAYPGQKGDLLEVNLNGKVITCEKINGLLIYQGDIVIDESQIREPGSLKGAAIKTIGGRWPNKVVYYTISPDLPRQSRVTEAIEHWEKHTDMEFVERTDQDNYVEFIWDASICASYVGMMSSRQNIWLADWGTKGNVIHEIGHAVGLIHEHSKPNRDNFVLINWDEIEEGKEHNFLIDEQALQTDGFDFESIMLYYSNAFRIGSKPTITKLDGSTYQTQRRKLSDDDIRMVNLLYSWPVADFSADQTSTGVGKPIRFLDQSSNNPTNWNWDFGDGQSSREQNPVHTYSLEGTYSVALTVSNSNGTDQMLKSGLLAITWSSGPGSFTDPRDAQVYRWKELNSRIWMAENLRFDAGRGSWCYENQPGNAQTYGRLYDQEAAAIACPPGWHVPSDQEWKDLERLLGMPLSALDKTGYRGTDQGSQLKEHGSSGMALPMAGWRSSIFSSFSEMGTKALVWTSTGASSSEAWARELAEGKTGVGRYKTLNSNGLSIRCIKNQ